MPTELNGADINVLHQMFLSPGFTKLSELLEEQFKEAVQNAVTQNSAPEEDVQILNNLRGCYDVLQSIKDISSEVSRTVEESSQGILFQRDNHPHPWIADSPGGTKGDFIR